MSEDKLNDAERRFVEILARIAYGHYKERVGSDSDQRTGLRILRLREVEQKVGLKKSQIYELMATGRFPKAVHLTKCARGWLEHEIDGFILQRVAASRVDD